MRSSITWGDRTLDKNIQKLRNNRPIAHLSLEELDGMLGGVKRGRVTYICGEPGTGKTSFADQIKTELAAAGLIVEYVTYELNSVELTAKSLSRMSGGRLRVSDISSENEDAQLLEDLERSAEYYRPIAQNIAFSESHPNTLDIGQEIKLIVEEKGRFDVLIVDYIQQIPPIRDSRYTSEKPALEAAVAGLRKIATRYNAAVFAISSINRQNYERRTIGLGAMGGSASIEYDADTIIHLSVEGGGAERRVNLDKAVRPVTASLLKNRFGKTGTVEMDFHTEYATFAERGKCPWRTASGSETESTS